MIIRKSSLLLSTYATFHPFTSSISISSTSSDHRRKSTRPQQQHRRHRRCYATITSDNADPHISPENDQHTWPEPPKGQPCPTPYQILAMKDNAGVYSKTRFYELVKLYHPDRDNGADVNIPQAVRIERYRLIVAAHTILSDPTKRSAYDRFGAGWNGKAEVGARNTFYSGTSNGSTGPFSQNWQDHRDPIWQNATWEDWERFYAWKRAQNGEGGGTYRPKQSPVYFANSYFLLLVMIAALMGSTANYNRAQDAGQYFVEQRDLVHDRAAKELRRVKQEASHSGSRQDRIEWFLRNREATLGLSSDSDAEALRQQRVDRLLPERDVCRSEEIVEKDLEDG